MTLPCHDITCESVPGSPSPVLLFVGMRGEPGNVHCIVFQPVNGFNCSAGKGRVKGANVEGVGPGSVSANVSAVCPSKDVLK